MQVSGLIDVHVRRRGLDTGQQPIHAAAVARADRARGMELAVVPVDRYTDRKRGPAAVRCLAPEIRQPIRPAADDCRADFRCGLRVPDGWVIRRDRCDIRPAAQRCTVRAHVLRGAGRVH